MSHVCACEVTIGRTHWRGGKSFLKCVTVEWHGASATIAEYVHVSSVEEGHAELWEWSGHPTTHKEEDVPFAGHRGKEAKFASFLEMDEEAPFPLAHVKMVWIASLKRGEKASVCLFN